MAKIASDLRKPDGLVVVPPGEEAAFLAPLPISRLWGVGEKTGGRRWRDYGVRTIGDLAALPPDVVVRRFGKHGASLVDRARGIDADPVHDGDPAKSVGHEHTFDVDTRDREIIERTLLGDGRRRRRRGCAPPASRPATVAVKIRDSSFRTITRQRTLAEPTDMTEPIFRSALELARPEVRGIRVRLLGVTASNLGEREQLALFERRRPAPPAGRSRRPTRSGAATASEAVTRARLLGRRAAGAVRAGPAQPARPARARGADATRNVAVTEPMRP